MFFLAERTNKILQELYGHILTDADNIPSCEVNDADIGIGEAMKLESAGWKPFLPGDRWGGRDKHCWFRTRVVIPPHFEGKKVVYQVKTGKEGTWDATNPQFLAYVDGLLVQGLDVNHREIVLTEKAAAGTVYSVILQAYSGMIDSLSEFDLKIWICHDDVKKLYYDMKVPYDVAVLLDKEDKRHIDILQYLNNAANILDLRKPGSEAFYDSIRNADRYLQEEFYGKYCGTEDVTAFCVGHTHIDVAWLWTLAQTREKAARSFSTVLNLMKSYPEYVFMSSQPQLYEFIKEDHPEIYEQIKDRVREGRWEPEGAMWLEADCNIISGESLVRQVLYGSRFFEKEFGVKSRILWLPDVFGYSAALPQILKKSGIDYFMTTKISWNEYNKMPYDTFMWKGLDGTEILTHFITTTNYKREPERFSTTYNGILEPGQVMGAWQRYQQKGLNDEVLIAYGYGDGGGGPTMEMLENAKRLEKGIPGCPKVRTAKSADFFRRLEEAVEGNSKLPKWVGELYLEYHRGTYTTMARNKKYNRKCEFLYQDAELLSVIDAFSGKSGTYPSETLNRGWKTILLNQFHDIIPGSSIKEVYEDSKTQYEEITEQGKAVAEGALKGICSKIKLGRSSLVVFNQLGCPRSDIVEFTLPDGCCSIDILDPENGAVKTQISDILQEDGTVLRKAVFFAKDIPAKGYRAYAVKLHKDNNDKIQKTAGAKPLTLSNKFFEIGLGSDGTLVRLYDRINDREVLKPGEKGNILQAFEDKPLRYDAWDINIYYQEKMWEVNEVESMELVEQGEVRTTLRIKKRFLDSEIIQDVTIYGDIPRIDFKTSIDWKEKQVLLKAAFPVDVNAEKATYEIQYGNVERPTHWNTSWDYARFEVCAHKWADLSEDGYGVSLLNDCKYGHDIKDGVMRLTLLKSAVYPNPDADKEKHEFTYSLYPHAGGWKEAGTVRMAYNINCPMYVRLEEAHDGPLPESMSFVSVDMENVMVEVVKKAEESGDIIVRVYECYNRRAKATLSFFNNISKVWECDLMERNLEEVESDCRSFGFTIKPYEIKTFKIRIA